MRASCNHGGSATPRQWGWRGGGVIACGSVESYGIYSVFYTCRLLLRVGLPCGPLLECVYLHRFLRIKKRTTRYLRCFCMFSEGFFRAGPILWCLHYYLHLLTAPARCVCVCFAHQEPKAWLLRCVGWFSEGDFPPGHLSSATFISCPVSACYFDSVGWAGAGGGYVRNKHTGYCAPCRLVFSIIIIIQI